MSYFFIVPGWIVFMAAVIAAMIGLLWVISYWGGELRTRWDIFREPDLEKRIELQKRHRVNW